MTQGRSGARTSQTPKHPIIKQLVDARTEQGLTQLVLAKKMGYSCSAVGDWECEKRFPTFHALQVWAQTLGFDLNLTSRG